MSTNHAAKIAIVTFTATLLGAGLGFMLYMFLSDSRIIDTANDTGSSMIIVAIMILGGVALCSTISFSMLVATYPRARVATLTYAVAVIPGMLLPSFMPFMILFTPAVLAVAIAAHFRRAQEVPV